MCLSALVLLVKFQSGNSWSTPGMHNLVLSISHQPAYDSPIDVVVPHSRSDVNSSLKSLMRERKATYWSVRWCTWETNPEMTFCPGWIIKAAPFYYTLFTRCFAHHSPCRQSLLWMMPSLRNVTPILWLPTLHIKPRTLAPSQTGKALPRLS